MRWLYILIICYCIPSFIYTADRGPLYQANNTKLMRAFTEFTKDQTIDVDSFGNSHVRLHLTKGVEDYQPFRQTTRKTW